MRNAFRLSLGLALIFFAGPAVGELIVTPGSLQFSTQVGKPVTNIVTLKNPGRRPARGLRIAAVGPFRRNDAGITNPCRAALQPRQSCRFGVVFSPVQAGQFSGRISVSNRAQRIPLVVPLRGTARVEFLPTLTSVSPTSGPLAGGGRLTLNGTNFRAGFTVSVGGVSCSSPALVSANQATCTIPAGAAGTKNVLLTNSDGQSVTLANAFTYLEPAPTLTSISPLKAASGQSVELLGQNLELITSAQIGGVNATVTPLGAQRFLTVPQGLSRGEVLISLNGAVQTPRLGFEPFCDPQSVVTDSNSSNNLAINHPSVVTDQNATFKPNDLANSRWSFPYLMGRIAGIDSSNAVNFEIQTAQFIERWAQTFLSVGSINGHNFGRRDFFGRITWPRKTVSEQSILDLEQSPMRLIAILYRPDLANAQQAGEGRFIYEVGGSAFTVILEYGLPINTTNSSGTWVKRWADLPSVALPSQAYNAALKLVTDSFIDQRFAGLPNQSAINQVRTNEIMLNFPFGPWQLREWKLISSNGSLVNVQLVPDTVKDTPKPNLNETDRSALIDWWRNESCSGAETPLPNCNDVIPSRFLAGAANTESISFNIPEAPPRSQLNEFDLMTCNGCHDPSVSGDGFTHAAQGRFSPFLINDLVQRRTAFRDALLNNFCQ